MDGSLLSSYALRGTVAEPSRNRRGTVAEPSCHVVARRRQVWLPHDVLYSDLARRRPIDGVLDLSGWKLNDGDLAAVGAANARVAGLKLKGCHEVTDAGVARLLEVHE